METGELSNTSVEAPETAEAAPQETIEETIENH